MTIEVEKKYVLTVEQWNRISARLKQVGAEFVGEGLEENIIFQGGILTETGAVLRIRKTADRTMLTYKLRVENTGAVKRQEEYETGVEDAGELEAIVQRLGFRRSLVYEKERKTWRLGKVEIVLDELPFGRYLEIEGAEEDIYLTEALLDAKDLETEHSTYPILTLQFGSAVEGVVESRF